jgi:hypothetical protein
VARRQNGHVTRAQMLALGISSRMIGYRLQTGRPTPGSTRSAIRAWPRASGRMRRCSRARFLTFVPRHQLPVALTGQSSHQLRIDAIHPERRLIVELDRHRFHSDRDSLRERRPP